MKSEVRAIYIPNASAGNQKQKVQQFSLIEFSRYRGRRNFAFGAAQGGIYDFAKQLLSRVQIARRGFEQHRIIW